jgi:hypothetical protein
MDEAAKPWTKAKQEIVKRERKEQLGGMAGADLSTLSPANPPVPATRPSPRVAGGAVVGIHHSS